MNARPLAARGLAAPDDRRRFAPADGADRAPDPQGAVIPDHTQPRPPDPKYGYGLFNSWMKSLDERDQRLRRLWQMSPEQRAAAMRRGELTVEELSKWSSRHPQQIPRIDGELEWIAVKTPEYLGD